MKTANDDEIFLAVAIFARDNISVLQLKLTLLSISKPKWFCSREHIFFRPFLESTVSTEYFYTLPVWKLFSCEVPISTWPALDRRYQMFAMHRPPWIVDVETDYILGMSRFRRIGYLCGKRNIYVKSLDCWVQFFLWQVNALFIKSPPCGRACFEIATRND